VRLSFEIQMCPQREVQSISWQKIRLIMSFPPTLGTLFSPVCQPPASAADSAGFQGLSGRRVDQDQGGRHGECVQE
jgi:hypothetical protein